MIKILGLGNALVDVMVTIPGDELLDHFNLTKGSMQHVGRKVFDDVLASVRDFKQVVTSGGSAANAIHGLASLGNQTAFIAKVGRDTLGDFFLNDMITNGIEPRFLRTDTETGIAVTLISPDGERTFAVYLGAAIELSADDMGNELFRGFDILHIEGYLVQNHELIETA
ncbi:MAG: PfkB family carbohydrate kinase, partial [Bacteroidales bacterium]|nr:PfkB family carbohydrate kinase [Bacteroidales bacterium]